MDDPSGLLAALADWPGARALRQSWIAYLSVNATHILGVGLLLGAILVLDLRLLGGLRAVPLAVLGPLNARVAAVGAIVTGLWLFSVQPAEYAQNPAFQIKLGVLAAALANVVVQHANPAYARAIEGNPASGGVRLSAAASALLWLAVLVAGRSIGFV